jgi:hypothetical protein
MIDATIQQKSSMRTRTADYLKEAASCLDYPMLCAGKINQWLNGRDVEGSDRDLGKITELAWRAWQKPWKPVPSQDSRRFSRDLNISNTSQTHCRLSKFAGGGGLNCSSSLQSINHDIVTLLGIDSVNTFPREPTRATKGYTLLGNDQ